MKSRYLFRGRRTDNGAWVIGHYVPAGDDIATIICPHDTHTAMDGYADAWIVDASTVGQCTGLSASKSYRGESKIDRLIFEGDIVRIVLHNGDTRDFKVKIETVRPTVKSHPDFGNLLDVVDITGVVFSWHGYEFFPSAHDYGRSDVDEMEIIGTVHESDMT